MGLKIIQKETFSPEQIIYGLRLGEHKGNSTITDFFLESDSMEEESIQFRIYGTIEREGLIDIFRDLANELEKHVNEKK